MEEAVSKTAHGQFKVLRLMLCDYSRDGKTKLKLTQAIIRANLNYYIILITLSSRIHRPSCVLQRHT